ncbi:hypothetical protein GPL06_12750 [Bacteroides salyersiae]|uniref:hypothetical protein n=1 Tax=Bacteroides salyersiae TaxID=291644 RepID=UPI00189BBF9A|nr:hypothetical protein [Bacteroides salyersiae]MBT9873664.1 hypothetical protein [Bacteroides salyersiae]
MRKMLCPQCKIAGMYVKNKQGDRLLVYITKEGVVIPKDEEASTEGFDFTEVYCLGCSWHGSPKRLIKF